MKRSIALFLGLATCSSAIAQYPEPETGTRLPTKPDLRPENAVAVRAIQVRFARCVVKKFPAAARTFVLGAPTMDNDDPAYRKLTGKLVDASCLGQSAELGDAGLHVSFPGDALLFILADELVSRDLMAEPVLDPSSVAPLLQAVIDPTEFQPDGKKRLSATALAELVEAKTKEEARIYLSRFGECVVRTDAGGARALLLAEVNSVAEGQAFAALVPKLGECVTAGQKFALGKGVVRGTIAYNYYRLAKAPRVPTTTNSGYAK